MDIELIEMGRRLRQARIDAGYPSVPPLVRRFGWNQSTYYAHERGQNRFHLPDALTYAAAFGVSAMWLMTGRGENPDTNRLVPVGGFIAAKGQVKALDLTKRQDSVREVRLMMRVEGSSLAYIIEAEDQLPGFEQGMVIVCGEPTDQVDIHVGENVIAYLADDRVLFRKIEGVNDQGQLDLSFHNANLSRDVDVKWVAPVISMVMPRYWKLQERPWSQGDLVKFPTTRNRGARTARPRGLSDLKSEQAASLRLKGRSEPPPRV